MVRPGDVGFGGKRSGFYPNAVRWFTRSRWSHCFVVTPPFLGEISVIETDLKVQLVSFQKEYVEKNADYYEIWRPIAATEEQIYEACRKVYLIQAGSIYGFLQIPWFALRAMCGWIGITLRRNPFPDGEICSELLWEYLVALGDNYREAFSFYTENECSPEDLYAIAKGRPDLFEFVIMRE